ncbi:MAG: hypothetical protein SFW08_05915 [Gemmatimonadaceae bacterium]|nr:hypothetical protein [Gemmatimonadaceae bacterium]
MSLARRRGFTFFEIAAVFVIIGVMVALVYPQVRRTEPQAVQAQATQLRRDLESLRSRALAAGRLIRVRFDSGGRSYSWITDVNGSLTFDATDSSLAGPGMIGSRSLASNVRFGRAGMPAVPAFPGIGGIVLDSASITFDHRGVTFPARRRGVIYFTGTSGLGAAAVSITGAGSFRIWGAVEGSWQ